MGKSIGNGITVEKVVVCEDVRFEMGNKHTLLGVLAGDVELAQFPAVFKIAAYADLVTEHANDETLETRWVFADSAQAGAINQFTSHPPNHVAVIMPTAMLMASGPGILQLEFRLKDQDWVVVEARKVQKAASAGPST